MKEPRSWNNPNFTGPVRTASNASSVFYPLGVVIVAIAALYFGRNILIPFALAALLSFALSPLVTRIRRIGVGRVPSVLLVTVLAFVVLGAIAALVGSQLINLADNLPTYKQNIEAKIVSLRSASPGGGTVERIKEMARDLDAEIGGNDQPAQAAPGKPPAPVVRVERPEPTPWEVVRSVAAPLIGPLGTAGIVVVLVIFMLLEREDLRDRLIRLFGRNLSITTEAMDDAASRVSRYLLMQLLVNATYGIPIGIGLYFIGVPNAMLWGVLATLLRFIPYVGPFIAAVFPLALAIAVDSGWSMLLWTVALFVAVELVSNNLVEPHLYGSSTGMSPLAVIMAAIFWTVLWGPVGLFLATPLTVCLAVVGRYVPQLRFLDIMLGSEPALTPEERFYQRMLAGDSDEGEDIAARYLEQHSLGEFYDDIVRPALVLAAHDRQRKALALERRAIVIETFMDVVAELGEPDPITASASESAGADSARATAPAKDAEHVRVLCAFGRSGLDMVAATVVEQLLEQRGVRARVLPVEDVSGRGPTEVPHDDIAWVLMSYVTISSAGQARAAARRLRSMHPGVKVAIGLWAGQSQLRLAELGATRLADKVFAASFAEAADAIALDVYAAPEAAQGSAEGDARTEAPLAGYDAGQ